MSLSWTVSEILYVIYWRSLEIRVRGHSRSLKMAQYDRSYTTSYQSTVVSIALFSTIFELFDAEEHRDREILVRVTQDHWKWHHSIGRIYEFLFVFHYKSCILSETKRCIGRKSRLFHTHLLSNSFMEITLADIFALFHSQARSLTHHVV